MKIVVFTGERCVPCKRLHAEFDKLLVEYPGIDIEYKKTEEEENLNEARRLNISSVPTVIVDNPSLRFFGFRSKSDLEDMLDL